MKKTAIFVLLLALGCLGILAQEGGTVGPPPKDDPMAEASKATGKVFVKSDPAGASIFLGVKDEKGAILPKDTGKKTPSLIEIPIGKQIVILSLVGYEDALLGVIASSTAITKPEAVVLGKPARPVDIMFFEDGWRILIDGKPVLDALGKPATTPCTVKMAIGKHDVSLAKVGFKDIPYKCDVMDKTDNLEIKGKIEKTAEKPLEKGEKLSTDVKELIGKWDVKIGKDWLTVWTFSDDFTVTSTAGTTTGTWSIKDKSIRIEWSAQAWESFYLPLNPNGTRGDSSHGKGIVFGKKKQD